MSKPSPLYQVRVDTGREITFAWDDVLTLRWTPGPHPAIMVDFKHRDETSIVIVDTPQSQYQRMYQTWLDWMNSRR